MVRQERLRKLKTLNDLIVAQCFNHLSYCLPPPITKAIQLMLFRGEIIVSCKEYMEHIELLNCKAAGGTHVNVRAFKGEMLNSSHHGN
jgi:hypothetical protein